MSVRHDISNQGMYALILIKKKKKHARGDLQVVFN